MVSDWSFREPFKAIFHKLVLEDAKSNHPEMPGKAYQQNALRYLNDQLTCSRLHEKVESDAGTSTS